MTRLVNAGDWLRTKLVVVVALALSSTALGLIATSSQTAQAHDGTFAVPVSGRTALKLDPDTARVLTDSGVTVSPAGEARAGNAGVAFPITGGLLERSTLAGKVKHTGGLTLTAGGRSLTIRDFVVNTEISTLTAYADEAGTRLPILKLALDQAQIHLTNTRLAVTQLPTTLTPKAATVLNDYFDTTLFTGGLTIGTVRLNATIRTLRS